MKSEPNEPPPAEEPTLEPVDFEAAAKIALLEYTYWRDLPKPEPSTSGTAEFLTGCQYGGMGAAANISAALALGKTVAEFEADIAKRQPAPPAAAGGGPGRPVLFCSNCGRHRSPAFLFPDSRGGGLICSKCVRQAAREAAKRDREGGAQ